MAFNPITPAECASLIRDAAKIAVLSGAGLSTAAGIPDFRGPKGLYVTRAYDPETVFEINYFDSDPKPFYRFTRDFIEFTKNLKPTFTHYFLAELEKNGRDIGIVTQNIDSLHQIAGSERVYPMHGDYRTAHCRKCNRGFVRPEVLAFLDQMEIPTCPDCGGVIKSDVVFFGQNVKYMEEAAQLVAASDLLLVLGSSLVVYPAALLPRYAGGDIVIVNQGPVGIEPAEHIFLADSGLDEFFREVAAKV